VVICFVPLFVLGCSDSGTEPEDPATTTLIAVGGEDQVGLVGARLADSLVVKVTDQQGDPLSNVTVTWAMISGGGTLSQTRSRTDIDGLARIAWTLGTVAGVNKLNATVSGLSPLVFTATGRAGAPAEVRLSEKVVSLESVGDTSRLVSVVTDQYENVIDSAALNWSSLAPEIVSIDESGLVTALDEGHTIIVARAGPAADSAIVLVGDLLIPEITAITPAILTPGVNATITGANFGALAGSNTVTIGGIAVEVATASETELMVTLPSFEAFGCRPTGPVAVMVDVAGLGATRPHPLRVARQLPALEVGAFQSIMTAGDTHCNELPLTGDGYLVSIYNENTAPTAISAFRLRGEGSPGVVVSPGPLSKAGAVASRSPVRSGRSGLSDPLGDARREARAHAALLEESRELVERLGPPRPGTAGARTDLDPPFAAAPGPLTEGTMLSLRIPDIDASSLCTSHIPVRARVVYAGPTAIVLEDSVAPLARTMDERYQALGREFEETMLPVLDEYFGDPLAYDANLGNTGRILMLFSPKVNDFKRVAGFVWAGDLYTRNQCNTSNEAQIFYAVVPTDSAAGYGSGTVDGWHRSIRSTVIHEVKHITSYAERFSRNSSAFEESWLEESTARLSEELWGRTVFGYTHKGGTGYRASIYCEVRPSWPECTGRPLIMMKHFDVIYDYLASTNTLSPLGGINESDATFYGSGWLLVRWALDHYATSEAGFVRALIQEPHLSGVANLEARTGKRFPELLAPWSLSLYWDEPTAPGLSHPSWDIRDIFRGINDDFPSSYPAAYPLTRRAENFGAFTAEISELRGGSAALFELSGTPAGTQLLELQGANGGTPPANLGVAIMRIR
jgi:hypothetical protein